MIKIEKVDVKPYLVNKHKYPWDDMKSIGDSFFVPGGSIGSLCGCAYSAGKVRGYKVRVRTENLGGVKGIRVVRIS